MDTGRRISFRVVVWCVPVLILVLCSGTVGASSWWTLYGGIRSESPARLVRSSDGSYFVVGSSSSFSPTGISEVWVMKLDADGKQIWQKSYGSGQGESAVATTDGGIILAATKVVNGNNSDLWIARLSKDGSIQWQEAIGGNRFDRLGGIAPASHGDYLLAGHTFSFGAGNRDLWAVRITSTGSIVWERVYGGSGQEFFGGVQPAPGGGFTLVGYTDSFSHQSNNPDICVLRLKGDGNILSQKVYGGPAADTVANAQRTPDGGIILVGSTRSSGEGQTDLLAVKLSGSGDIQWQRSLGGPGLDAGYAVNRTTDGNFLIVGTKNSAPEPGNDAWVVKVKYATGEVLWQKVFGGSATEIATEVRNHPAGGYLVLGKENSQGAGANDVFAMKLEPDGSIGSACTMVRDTVKTANSAVLKVSSLSLKVGSSKAYILPTQVQPVDTSAVGKSACTVTSPTTITWSVRLTKEMLVAAGYVPDATVEAKLQNTAYSVKSILNSETDRLVDEQKCQNCHTGQTTQGPARYLPHFYPFGPTIAHWQDKSQSLTYRWDDKSNNGIVYHFRNANVSKPEGLKAILQKWLDDGALP